MAVENVKKFFELVKSDEKLSREIAKIKDEIQNKGETVDYEQIISKKVIPMAKKHGLDFTMEDFLKYTNSMVQQGELSDDDLLNVSGGMNLRQGLATGLLMLTVGTTGLSLMGNLTVPGGDGSGSGGAAPTTSYSQSIDNGTEDEEVVDTENDEREDNEFNDEDDAVPATEGVSMDMLGAGESGSTDVTGGGVAGGAAKSATATKAKSGGGVVGGAAKSATATKATAGGGVAGGAAKSTTATKTTAGGGAGAGGAAGATTTKKEEAAKPGAEAAKKDETKEETKTETGKKSEEAKKDEAAKPGAEAAKKDEAKKDEAAKPGAEAAKKDETKEETKTETGKKSEEAKKDEAAKTEATEKQEYKKFGEGSLFTYWGASSWSAIGKHIYGEMEKVGFKIDNFSNKDAALSDIKAYVDGAKIKESSEEKRQYDKIKTSYDNYTAEVAKKDLAKKVAEEAAKKAAENEAKKAAAEKAAANAKKKEEALETSEAQAKIKERKEKNKNLVLDVGSIFEDEEKEAEEEAKKEIYDLAESLRNLKNNNLSKKMQNQLNDFVENYKITEKGVSWKGFVLEGKDAIELINHINVYVYVDKAPAECAVINKNAKSVVDEEGIDKLQELLNKLDESIKEEKTKGWPQELKDKVENFRKEAENIISNAVEYTGLKRDVLTLKSFADKVETVNELAKVLKDSENGKNMTKESRAKLEADTLKLGFVLYDVNTGSFNVQGDDYFTFFEDGDEANIHAVENYYKEISKDLKDFNDRGYTLEGKAENLVKELNEVNGEWYRFSPKTVKTAVQRINEVGAKIGTDDGYYLNDAWVGTNKKRDAGEDGLKMIKTAADELANLAKK